MRVETGVIAAAGTGTRMLPVTLGYPKELLPIINKPAIHLIVEELIDSGIKRIVIVTGSNSAPLRRQYDPSQISLLPANRSLRAFIDKISNIEIIFKPQEGPYGNGTPVMVAKPHIPAGEGFIYSYGDDIVRSSTPFARHLIEKHERTGALVVGVQEIPWEDVVHHGIAQVKEGSQDRELLDVVEKPTIEESQSNLAMFGRFLLSHDIVEILGDIPLGKSNELWLTDSVREYIRRGGRVVAEAVKDGEWLTIGDPLNYLKTLLKYTLSDRELRTALEPMIRSMLDDKQS